MFEDIIVTMNSIPIAILAWNTWHICHADFPFTFFNIFIAYWDWLWLINNAKNIINHGLHSSKPITNPTSLSGLTRKESNGLDGAVQVSNY